MNHDESRGITMNHEESRGITKNHEESRRITKNHEESRSITKNKKKRMKKILVNEESKEKKYIPLCNSILILRPAAAGDLRRRRWLVSRNSGKFHEKLTNFFNRFSAKFWKNVCKNHPIDIWFKNLEIGAVQKYVNDAEVEKCIFGCKNRLRYRRERAL